MNVISFFSNHFGDSRSKKGSRFGEVFFCHFLDAQKKHSPTMENAEILYILKADIYPIDRFLLKKPKGFFKYCFGILPVAIFILNYLGAF